MNTLSWNRKLFYWLVSKGDEERPRMPWYIIALRWVLLPVDTLRWKLVTTGPVTYDIWTDILIIYGMKYHGSLFRGLSDFGLKTGIWLKIINREDGVITIGTVPQALQEEFTMLADGSRKGNA